MNTYILRHKLTINQVHNLVKYDQEPVGRVNTVFDAQPKVMRRQIEDVSIGSV